MQIPAEQNVLNAIAKHRMRKERVVFTNGCFDILHCGHVRYLTQARALGELLVVGLNSDSSVSKLKGAGRPIVPQEERAEVLLGLRAVDYVVIFNEETPYELIARVQPDVLVKGGDWDVGKIIGADIVQARGGAVHSLPFVDGCSTTNIVAKIRSAA